jgi:uncharacterized protein (DUF1800 family)
MTPPIAGHLLRRTTFGFTSDQLQQTLADGPAKTIDRLLAIPSDYAAFEQSVAALVSPEATSQDSGQVWLYRMRNTPYPLLEKATLFWYNFFAVAGSQVPQPTLMEQHIKLLRKHALGRFDQMLLAVAQDPAALIANGPPPMVDREAFSGVTVLRGEYHYDAARHRGNLTPEEAVRKALAEPATTQTVVRRVSRWLIGDVTPPAPLVEAFARDYNIGKLVGAILRSSDFPRAYRQDIKSPLEFALNLAIPLCATLPPAELQTQLAALGQRLPDPPSRDGWPGGRRWLNHYTIIGRSRLAAAIIAKAEHPPDRQTLLSALLQNDAPPESLRSLAQLDGHELARAIANLPEFQLS